MHSVLSYTRIYILVCISIRMTYTLIIVRKFPNEFEIFHIPQQSKRHQIYACVHERAPTHTHTLHTADLINFSFDHSPFAMEERLMLLHPEGQTLHCEFAHLTDKWLSLYANKMIEVITDPFCNIFCCAPSTASNKCRGTERRSERERENEKNICFFLHNFEKI